MRIPLDRQSEIPVYEQIEKTLRKNILSGNLAPETRLPGTRTLAEELGVSRITVKNAYAWLESDGLIATRAGSGTYVLAQEEIGAVPKLDKTIPWPLWQQQFYREEPPPVGPARPQRDRLQLIQFTGVGDPDQFPLRDFTKSLLAVLRRDGVAALEYGDFNGGHLPLRRTIAHILASQGIQARPENILVTSGSQQALSLICQVLLKAGDVILVEKPTYNFALELFRDLGYIVEGIPIDGNGMRVEDLELLLQQAHPKLIYTIPNFQNPSGVCMSSPRRRQLLALSDRYNIPILEDDFAGDLRYDGRTQPAIKGLDNGGRVIYTGTFSKMLMPGLRMGFLLADGPIFARLVEHKRVHDLATSSLLQRTLDEYVTVGRYQAHLRRSCRVYSKRREAMLAAIGRHLPKEVTVDPPQGGLFIWLRLPEGIPSPELLEAALEEGVEFAPGTRFFPDPAEGERYLRLNFATQPPENIEAGIRRLGKAMKYKGVSSDHW
jgi:GntR family transcriptional regulator/MocR family aminotransferase